MTSTRSQKLSVISVLVTPLLFCHDSRNNLVCSTTCDKTALFGGAKAAARSPDLERLTDDW